MTKVVYETKEEILIKGKEAIGIPLKEIDKTGRLKTGKGAIGTVIEESWFEYKVNSKSAPDFEEAGVELKVIPYIKAKHGLKAKERVVCNIINYMEEYKYTFSTSSFWKKCETILFMAYEHRTEISKEEYCISAVELFNFHIDDLKIIEKDWENIVNKIRQGKAHEISEGDTLYLGACTKGANAKSLREQPFSSIKAKQRAFSLKQSYMTYVINNYIFKVGHDEKIIKDVNKLAKQSFEDYIISKVKPFFGKPQKELLKRFKVNTTAKNINELLLGKMLGIKGKISATAEFQKANIVPKTIRVNRNGSITESMSFPTFKFTEIIKQEWENSDFCNMLEQTKFLFVIFRRNENDDLIFDNIKFWNMPEVDIKEAQKVWERTVEIIKEGVVLTPTEKCIRNNLPKATESRVAHVRPHARDKNDTYELPDGRKMPKQCFWLNNTYIREQIEK